MRYCRPQINTTMTVRRKLTIQLWTAFILSMGGMVLLIMGFWVPPVGEIHNSVLIAYGEVCTFAGGLFGIDYTYKYKKHKNNLNNNSNGQTDA